MARYYKKKTYRRRATTKRRAYRKKTMLRRGIKKRVGVRKAYKAVRDTVLTMNTPKYYRFAQSQVPYCTTPYAGDNITEPCLIALHAQVASPVPVPAYLLGWYPAPYTSDSISSQAGLRSDRCYLKTMHDRFMIGPYQPENNTETNACIGVRIIKFTPKGIASY